MLITTPDSETASAARAGVIAITPLILGFAPFALAVGAAIGASAYHQPGIASSWFIYGGSAQLTAVRTLESGGAAAAILAALLINTRLVVYSASLAQHWRDQPRWFRIAAAPLLVDPVWAVADARAMQPGTLREQRAHYFGSALTLAFAWTVLVTAGVLLGSHLGIAVLGVAAPLCLLSLVGPRLLDRRTRTIVVSAAAAAILARNFPSGSSIFVAIILGCAVGELTSREPS